MKIFECYVVVFVCSVLAAGLGLHFGERTIKKQAIEQSCAEYDNKTGEWQWKDKKS